MKLDLCVVWFKQELRTGSKEAPCKLLAADLNITVTKILKLLIALWIITHYLYGAKVPP